MIGVVVALLAAWPVTLAEAKGDAYVYDARVKDSAPCSPQTKTPIELKLFAKANELRLTVKNCTVKTARVLHDAHLQPSKLVFDPAPKSVADERALMKYDPTVRLSHFLAYAPGEERVVAQQKVTRGSSSWGVFAYEGVAAKVKVKAVLEAPLAEGLDEKTGKKVPVPDAVTGTFTSNEVTLTLP